ncbi:hypothetical protein SDJN03_29049, partial [Cucurbita argyrosperma subsp. sororia]
MGSQVTGDLLASVSDAENPSQRPVRGGVDDMVNFWRRAQVDICRRNSPLMSLRELEHKIWKLMGALLIK